MLMDLAILAQDESGGRVLFAVAVIILVVGGAIFEKLKQQAAEAERKRRLSSPPSVPPVARPPLGRVDSPSLPSSPVPPPVALPPSATRWPPVVNPGPSVRRQPAAQPRSRSADQPTPRRREVPREASRPAETVRPAPLGAGVQQAVGDLEKQIEGEFRGQVGDLQQGQSMAQMRAAQRKLDPPAVGPAAFRKPTAADLRRAIVLNELLGPPLALREDE